MHAPHFDSCRPLQRVAEKTNTLQNMPVVPDKSTAKARLKGESTELQGAWYQGQVAKFISFEEACLSGGDVLLSPIYVTFNVNPDQPNGGLVRGSRPKLAPSKPITCPPRCLGTRHTLHCGWWPSATTPIGGWSRI